MTVEQLQQLYYNPELQMNTQFVDQFVQKEEKKSSHEFHEIVMNYQRSRKSLLSVEEDLKSLRQNYEQVQNELWVIRTKNVTVEGQCADSSKVTKVHTYEQCELNKDALANLTSTLLSIRNEMQEVEKLKDCISVLFVFHRKPTQDTEFGENLRKWTERLDEDPSQAWLYLHENDIVSILQQFPMDAIFSHLLQAPMDESGNVQYDIRRCTEPTMMKLFAFCTTWISLLGAGLNTYSMARYRQLNKRLGRLIRQTIAFVSDHWLNFKTYYGQLASAASLERLQMEFDQLFMRATYTILTAQKEDMKDLESRRQLADTLQKLPTSESIYLLTTFANMAASRPLEEDEFIECITLQVFEIAYICDHTRDFCSKTGRELLSSVIQKHPTAFSMLLRRVQVVMSQLGMMALYLFHELPASIWIPQDPDMLLLRQWLLNTDIASAENQLARVVLDRMNWDLFAETGKLVLDIRLHRQVALLLVESYVKFISERRASYLIVEGMRQQSSREQQFNNWAWALALRLKLHRESAILHSKAAESHPFQAPSLEQEPCTNQFMCVGLDMLMTLATSSQYSAVIHILSCITPQFLATPQYLVENDMFQKILQMVLSADENVLRVTKMVLGVEFPGTVTRQFTQMIQVICL
nr:hypothetical protein BaRGS_001032 [Batillaria attramentaria]